MPWHRVNEERDHCPERLKEGRKRNKSQRPSVSCNAPPVLDYHPRFPITSSVISGSVFLMRSAVINLQMALIIFLIIIDRARVATRRQGHYCIPLERLTAEL